MSMPTSKPSAVGLTTYGVPSALRLTWSRNLSVVSLMGTLLSLLRGRLAEHRTGPVVRVRPGLEPLATRPEAARVGRRRARAVEPCTSNGARIDARPPTPRPVVEPG